MRVFLSSTAEDLQDYRDAVAKVVATIGLHPVRMENFGARPKPAVAECQALAASCELAIVVVAHRYGWVPAPSDGGDGRKSITWLEVEAMYAAGKPVLVFLVDPTHPWTARREQDELERAADDTAAAIVGRRVRDLAEFKAFLNRTSVRDTFTTPADLASKVSTSLHNWLAQQPRVVAAPVAATHSNLPTRPALVGRESETARLVKALAAATPIVLIDGIGGIGKTALALDIAHQCLLASQSDSGESSLPRFAGFVWTSAKDRELRFEHLLDTIARTLDEPDLTNRTIEDREASIRHILSEEPTLLIVDNFESVHDDRIEAFLSTLPAGSRALVTSRVHNLRDATPVSISGLTPEAAVALVRQEANRLGLTSVEAADATRLEALTQAAGGAPIVIRWAMGQIKQKGQSLQKVVASLLDAEGDVFQEVFVRSWRLLGDDARRVLTVMPIFAAPTIRVAIEAACDVRGESLDAALGQLVTMRLVEVADELDEDRRRHSIHPLTRAFALDRLRDQPELERSARARAVAFFVKWTQHRGDKFAWAAHPDLVEELPNVMAFARWAHENDDAGQVLAFQRALYYFLGVRGYWTERLELDAMAIGAARARGDGNAQAWALIDLSWIQIRRNELREARQSANQALVVAGHLDDPMAVLTSKRRLSEIDEKEGRFEEAEQSLHEALQLNEHLPEPRRSQNLVRLRQSLGSVYYHLKRLEEARTELEAVVDLARQTGAENWRALILSGLGNIAREQGRAEEAVRLYEESMDLWRRVGQMAELAETKRDFSVLLITSGEKTRAEQLLREALRSFHRLGASQEATTVETLLEELVA